MTWNVTLEIMLPPRGSDDFASEYTLRGEQKAGSALTAREKLAAYRIGSVVSIRPYRVPERVDLPRTGFVHVTGIPDAVRPGKLVRALTELWPGVSDRLPHVERRKWGASLASVPLAMRRRLRDDRQIEITWEQAKGFYRRLTDNHAPTDEDFA